MQVKRGDILYSTNFPYIDHGKFFVVIGQNDNEIYGAFFINSNVRNYLYSKPKLLELQVGLGSDNYPFLTHNSYLDCSQIIKIAKTDLEDDINSKIASFRGTLFEDDLEQVMELIRASDVFTPKDKEFFK